MEVNDGERAGLVSTFSLQMPVTNLVGIATSSKPLKPHASSRKRCRRVGLAEEARVLIPQYPLESQIGLSFPPRTLDNDPWRPRVHIFRYVVEVRSSV